MKIGNNKKENQPQIKAQENRLFATSVYSMKLPKYGLFNP